MRARSLGFRFLEASWFPWILGFSVSGLLGPFSGLLGLSTSCNLVATRFAMVSPITWDTNHPCHAFWASGRLQAVILYLHDGSAVVLYNIYGPAGARESATAKRTLKLLLQAVTDDAATRSLPSILVGDFNAEVEENQYMQTLLQAYWHDVAVVGSGETRNTCNKGSGSRIDHIWCSQGCRPMMLHFDLHPTPFTRKGHCVLEVAMGIPDRAKPRLTPRRSCSLDHLKAPDAYCQLCMPQSFDEALRHRDVDSAAAIWSKQAEQILISIHEQQHGSDLRLGQPRGKVQFDCTRQTPKAQHEHADNLQLRKLAQAYRRASEIAMATPGTRTSRTWKNLQSVMEVCPASWKDELEPLLRGAPNARTADAVAKIIQRIIQLLEYQQKRHRLKLWKQQMRNNVSASSTWRKKQQALKDNPYLRDHKHYSAIVMKVGNAFTIDSSRQLRSLIQEWDKMFGKHRKNPPTTWAFIQHYGPFLKREPRDLDELQQNDILETVLSLKPSAAGLDGWRPQDLRLLGNACPQLFLHLARLMNMCEKLATWPRSWTVGYVAMLPKNLNSQGQVESAYDMRPITVLSALYRLWSGTRCRHIMPWILRVLPSEVYALRPGQGADDLAVDVSYLKKMITGALDCHTISPNATITFSPTWPSTPYLTEELLFLSYRACGAFTSPTQSTSNLDRRSVKHILHPMALLKEIL